jgi:hypothetical protein
MEKKKKSGFIICRQTARMRNRSCLKGRLADYIEQAIIETPGEIIRRRHKWEDIDFCKNNLM